MKKVNILDQLRFGGSLELCMKLSGLFVFILLLMPISCDYNATTDQPITITEPEHVGFAINPGYVEQVVIYPSMTTWQNIHDTLARIIILSVNVDDQTYGIGISINGSAQIVAPKTWGDLYDIVKHEDWQQIRPGGNENME